MTFLEVYSVIEVFNMYNQSLLNLSGGVTHSRDLVGWKEEKKKPCPLWTC